MWLDFANCSLQIIANLTVTSRNKPTPRKATFSEFVAPLKEIAFTLTTIGSFCFFLGLFLPFNYIIIQAQIEGMSAYLASYLLAILNAVRYVSSPNSNSL